MVRVYKRKSQRGEYGEERLATALKAINQGMPLIRVSKEMGIPARTLRRHRDQRTTMPGVLKLGRHTTTLSVTLERQLHDHIMYMEKSLYGLTPRDVRRLAFDLAVDGSATQRVPKMTHGQLLQHHGRRKGRLQLQQRKVVARKRDKIHLTRAVKTRSGHAWFAASLSQTVRPAKNGFSAKTVISGHMRRALMVLFLRVRTVILIRPVPTCNRPRPPGFYVGYFMFICLYYEQDC